jgi:glycosyltransferase involved in cell wall biosynthesis
VIVPNYNHGRYLRRRIESVLGQTFVDFELIILDDCSTDDSRDVIVAYTGDPRVVTVFNDRNSGSTFKQWDKGLRLARGEFVWFAESDDYADPTLLETLVDLMERHPNAGLAMSQSWVVDEDDRIIGSYLDEIGKLFDDVEHWRSDYVNSGPSECATYCSRVNSIPNASAVLFRRRALHRAGRVPIHLRLCGDWMLYTRVLRHSDIAFVARPLNYFRTHPGSVRGRSDRVDVAWRESIVVRREVARALGLSRGDSWSDEVRAYVFTAIDNARRPPHHKVPPRDLPALLTRLASPGWEGLRLAVPILVREQFADLARRLRLLGPLGGRRTGPAPRRTNDL